ncbi:hydroxylamine reductase Hcp [Paenibacillus larvae subsp. larvae]|uniref:Hydroxylamine reductase n=1 Tax=Paenibacillus larvae subsp. larvae TaxID=147375 RepID=A0A2L1TZZ7_9BACL|nr:hydroxylamine reductase [Paenibacillus larvae]AQT86597.1 hydroxylamine reductase [Paenibacillus larvae subsp. pulvifaciens]AQZ48280.1 hydroxylamine reductase [Paenibacillus larvae subsp. pulvifaciens]AVF26257.1 hydroxylamine reductase Hcp [Paenibacillus larvae subsp. larvae]AVF31034.1 hydroxylamine reductase Hcp [Paenibacillus larvae subsp. larvae]MBH0343766.1 hydroxylamine reductase [Paenibacillus larvae]
MFCYQCEQTPSGGCTVMGVCGKNEDIASLQDTIIFGLKGVAAYATHARQLGYTDPFVDQVTHEALYMTLTNSNFNLQEHLDMAMKVGEATVRVMDLLDRAHTDYLGIPNPVQVSQNKIEGKCIVVTGHNLFALEQLLKQTEGKGIHVYTHSEMLPAHGYPKLNKYPHLKGNIGKAWYDQRRLFEEFPGAILATTNCVMPIKGTYADRFFSYEVVGLEGVTKISGNDFSPLIERALELPEAHIESEQTLMTGYHHETVLGLAPEIVEAVQSGKIRHFFVIAGCDAPGKGGNYYRELATRLPADTVILTTSCGKFRFNDVDYGLVPGTDIPRYIDLGQCNNSGSTVKIALALADAFGCSVNELPVSIVLSWFEQKAVAILLGLFSLGIRDIRIGPKPPEFLTEGVMNVLVNTFGLKLIGDVQEDMNIMLAR